MHADLMSSASPWDGANQAEAVAEGRRSGKAPLHSKLRQGWRPGRMNHLFEPDRRVLMFALTIQRGFDDFVLPFRPAPDNRKVFFAQLVSLHQQAKIARGRSSLCNKNKSAVSPFSLVTIEVWSALAI